MILIFYYNKSMNKNTLIYRIFVNIIGMGFAAFLFKHITIDSFYVLIGSAVVLTLLNMFLKPLLLLITLPLQILSFGFFYLITNAIILMLTSFFFESFTIDGFWTAIGGSIIIGLINIMFDLFSAKTELRYFEWK